ncbi:MAG: sigma-70 family RNA polymerase sigma factor [Planctomycetota bacterium]|nr:sigma-70 family RNA polymerase sigma factor [Planctomycetota bacterium]
MHSKGFQELVRRAQEGDRQAMDRVLETLGPYLEKIARSYADPVRPVVSTQDLLQDGCLRAWNNLGSFEGGDNDERTFEMFRAWIGQIVRRLGRNAARDRNTLRQGGRKKLLSLDQEMRADSTTSGPRLNPPSLEPTPSANLRTEERFQRINAALENLGNDSDAAIVRMHFFDGLTLPMVAERLDLEYDYVRERCRVTMRRLEKELKGWL